MLLSNNFVRKGKRNLSCIHLLKFLTAAKETNCKQTLKMNKAYKVQER